MDKGGNTVDEEWIWRKTVNMAKEESMFLLPWLSYAQMFPGPAASEGKMCL